MTMGCVFRDWASMVRTKFASGSPVLSAIGEEPSACVAERLRLNALLTFGALLVK